MSIPAGETRTVVTSLLSGILNSQFMWPLMHAPLAVELPLPPNASDVCADNVAAYVAGGSAVPARPRRPFR